MKKKSYFKKNKFRLILTAIILVTLVVGVFFGTEIFLKKRLPVKYSEYVEKYAAEYNLDKYLVYSIISTESSFRKNVKSSVGATGLMQLMPQTAAWVKEKYSLNLDETNLTDPDTNIHLGCCYLRFLLDYLNSEENAICAYNCGEANVLEWLDNSKYSSDGKKLDVIPYKETKNYLKKVTTRYEIYKDLYSK